RHRERGGEIRVGPPPVCKCQVVRSRREVLARGLRRRQRRPRQRNQCDKFFHFSPSSDFELLKISPLNKSRHRSPPLAFQTTRGRPSSLRNSARGICHFTPLASTVTSLNTQTVGLPAAGCALPACNRGAPAFWELMSTSRHSTPRRFTLGSQLD